MAKMICLRPIRYAGKLLKPGDHFDVKELNHVKLLSLIHKAKAAEEGNPKEEAVEATPEEPKSTSPKRRYRRRDMQAEDA
jgi:hypothetical protein